MPLAIPRSLEYQVALQNTAVGDLALEDNDATKDGDANFNTAVGAQALAVTLMVVRTQAWVQG